MALNGTICMDHQIGYNREVTAISQCIVEVLSSCLEMRHAKSIATKSECILLSLKDVYSSSSSFNKKDNQEMINNEFTYGTTESL